MRARAWCWGLLVIVGCCLTGCPPEPPPPPRGFTVRLVDVGATPDAVVAAVCSATGYTELVARKLVEKAPSTGVPLGTGLSRAEADAIAASLRAAGAEATILDAGGGAQ